MAYKKWIIADADKERASEVSEKFNIDPFVAFLLVSEKILTFPISWPHPVNFQIRLS